MFAKLADALELEEIMSVRVQSPNLSRKNSFEEDAQVGAPKNRDAIQKQLDSLLLLDVMKPIHVRGTSGSSKMKKTKTMVVPKLMRFKTVLRSYADFHDDIELKGSKKCKLSVADTRVRYSTVLIVLVILSLIFFAGFAILPLFGPAYGMFGPGILVARGSALNILLFTMMAMFMVTYDVTTYVRKCIKHRCATLFDFQILFHRF